MSSGGSLKTLAACDLSEEGRASSPAPLMSVRGEITLELELAEATLADPNANSAVLREKGRGIVAGCI